MPFQRKKPLAIGTKALFLGFVAPALATPIEKVSSGERWIHEIKFDGYRVQVHLANEAVKISADVAVTGHYSFGANQLHIVKALDQILDHLEENHQLKI